MRTISNLFRGSPFGPLKLHMDEVVACVHKMKEVYDAYAAAEFEKMEELAREVSQLEHNADLKKNEIRNKLPKGIFLAVNRADILEILSLQDTIADKAEDIAILLNLKRLETLTGYEEELEKFVIKNIETVDFVHKILNEMNELLEATFGGTEAELVVQMVERVAFLEHEVDLLQASLLKRLFSMEEQLPYTSFYVWTNIFRTVASLSNTAEKLANKVRMLLELN